jgi:hypothetical protein
MKNLNQIKKFELFCEGKKDRLDYILDKINKYGESSLSNAEKEILKGTYKSDKPDAHYNKYITKLLNDLKSKEITEDIAKQFVEKYVTKEDLFSMLLQLMRDGKLDILLNSEKIKDTDDE